MLAYIWQIVIAHASPTFFSHFLLGSSVVFFMGFYFILFFVLFTQHTLLRRANGFLFQVIEVLMEVTGSKQRKKHMSESGNCYKEKQNQSKRMIF